MPALEAEAGRSPQPLPGQPGLHNEEKQSPSHGIELEASWGETYITLVNYRVLFEKLGRFQT